MVDSQAWFKVELTTDEVHLNQAGYIVMSEIVNRVIRDRLKGILFDHKYKFEDNYEILFKLGFIGLLFFSRFLG